MKKLIFILTVLILNTNLFSQFMTNQNKELMDLARKGIDYIYGVKPDKAHETFSYIIEKYPDHPIGHFGIAMSKWAELEYLEEESSEELYNEYIKLSEKAIDVGKNWVKKNPKDSVALMCLGGAYGLMARLYVMQHSWIKAYFTGKKAVKYMKKALEVNPEEYDAYLGLGLWEYSAGTLPGVVKWLAKLLISGDAKKGIEYLKLCKEKGYFNATAAELLLIEIFTEHNSKYANPELAVKWSKELVKQYPNVAQMHFVLIVSLYEAKKYDEAEKEMFKYLENIEKGVGNYSKKFLPRIYVSIGTIEMIKKNYGRAEEYFTKAKEIMDKDKKSNRWSLWGVVRLGNLYDLKGMREKAVEIYRKALKYKDMWGFKEFIENFIDEPFNLDMRFALQLPPP